MATRSMELSALITPRLDLEPRSAVAELALGEAVRHCSPRSGRSSSARGAARARTGRGRWTPKSRSTDCARDRSAPRSARLARLTPTACVRARIEAVRVAEEIGGRLRGASDAGELGNPVGSVGCELETGLDGADEIRGRSRRTVSKPTLGGCAMGVGRTFGSAGWWNFGLVM